MGQFFRGWRRKAGCVLLVMAMAMMGGWMRSRVADDSYRFVIGNRQHYIFSAYEHIVWGAGQPADGIPFQYGWNSSSTVNRIVYHATYRRNRIPEKPRPWFVPESCASWGLPYWKLTIITTMLSAALILWPVRRTKPQAVNSTAEKN